MTTDELPDQPIGPVSVTDIAHGGHCVGRFDGRVLFIRHALPGEVVMVRVTDTSHDRFWRADAVEILSAAPGRRTPPCPVFHPDGCGGCDFQHADEAIQRELKTSVVRDQLARLGGFDWSGEVEEVEPVWGWRTRMRFRRTPTGLGLRAHRSHRVIELPDEGCRIAAAEADAAVGEVGGEVVVVAAADGVRTVNPDDRRPIIERAAGREYDLSVNGFWQVHPRAADLLVEVVLTGLDPQPGERAFDLYCGVGLFAGALVDRGAQVWGVESARDAVEYARRNVPGARFTVGRVERVLNRLPARTDLVVLDPPRAGAGRRVLQQVIQRRPRAVAYVACDPAALGRDIGYARELGWRVDSVRAFDLFPQTHHIECVAILRAED